MPPRRTFFLLLGSSKESRFLFKTGKSLKISISALSESFSGNDGSISVSTSERCPLSSSGWSPSASTTTSSEKGIGRVGAGGTNGKVIPKYSSISRSKRSTVEGGGLRRGTILGPSSNIEAAWSISSSGSGVNPVFGGGEGKSLINSLIER